MMLRKIFIALHLLTLEMLIIRLPMDFLNIMEIAISWFHIVVIQKLVVSPIAQLHCDENFWNLFYNNLI